MTNSLTASEKNRVIRKYLKDSNLFNKISVTGSTGTAYGWINVTVDIKEKVESLSRFVEKMVIEALKTVNEKPYTYCSDDGYDTERNCILVN